MCNLYSQTKGQQAIIALTKAMRDKTGNLPPLPGIFPDYQAPVVRNAPDGERELAMLRWGMPMPQNVQYEAAGKRADKLRAKGQGRRFRRTVEDGAGRRRHQHSRHHQQALEALARRGEPLRRPVHVIQRVQQGARWRRVVRFG